NHVAAAGGIEPALRAVQHHLATHLLDVPVEVEVTTLAQLDEVLRLAGTLRVDRVLLDNMARPLPDGTLDTSLLREAVARAAGRVETEASGNLTLETAPAIAATGVDFISSGALTHSVRALD